MNKPVLYDVFCGAGGATRGYQLAGFRVVGIDHQPQPRYCGDDFIQMEAFEFFDRCGRGEYPPPDAWHCSPPCQAYSPLRALQAGKEYPDLLAPTREALQVTGLPYVIENVPGALLHHYITLCGGMFDLRTYRHRRFETSFLVFQPHHPPHRVRTCTKRRRAGWDAGLHVSITGDVGVYVGSRAMGIDWMTGNELSQAIPPAYCQFIGEQLMRVLAVLPGWAETAG